MESPRPRPDGNPVPDDAQRVFDVATGPNLRLRDNVIQLLVIVAGTILGALAGAAWGALARNGPDLPTGAVVGGFFGLLAALLLSGAVIGLIRGILAFRR